MLWAQHADASAHYERPERGEVICLRVIVFELSARHKLPTTTNSRSLCEGTMSWRTETQSAVPLTDQDAALSPGSRSRRDVSEPSAFSELVPSKDGLLLADSLRLGCTADQMFQRDILGDLVSDPRLSLRLSLLCPDSPSPGKRNYFGECLSLNPFWGTNTIADKVKSHLLNVGQLNQSHHGSSTVTWHHLSVHIRIYPHVEMVRCGSVARSHVPY